MRPVQYLGAYAGGYGYLAGGGKNPDGFLASVAGGALGGLVSPVRGATLGARAVVASGARAMGSGLLSSGATTYLSK